MANQEENKVIATIIEEGKRNQCAQSLDIVVQRDCSVHRHEDNTMETKSQKANPRQQTERREA